MFWALEQRQKRQKAFRDEIAAQVRQDVAAQIESDFIERIAPLAEAKGITTIDELAKELEEERRRKEREAQTK